MLALVATANLTRAAFPLKWGIGEMNIDYKNQPTCAGTTSNFQNCQDGLSSRSFLAGQWIAEMYAVGLRAGASFMIPWSVKEGAGSYDLGFLESTYNGRPTYFHTKMMSKYYKGSCKSCNMQCQFKSFWKL